MIVSPRCTRRAAAPLTHDLARAALAGDRVGLEAGAVVDVDDVHLLVLEDVGGLEQVRVDRDRADVVQVAVGDRRPVDLRLEHHALHRGDRLSRGWLAGGRAAAVAGAGSCCRSGAPRRRGRRPPAAPRRSSSRERLERLGVDERQVLGLDAGARAAPRAAAASSARPSARRRREPRGRAQRGRQRERAGALVGAEQGVAAGHRQAVGLAHGRQRLDRARAG